MEKTVSKTKVAKGGKKKVVKPVVESEVSDSASDISSVSPVEVKSTKSKKATKVVKATKATKAKEVVEEVQQETTAPTKTKKTKAKKEKDPNAPKKELNPIMKEMNKFRNEVIGPVVGSKAPKLTIPPFKLAMADARQQMGLGEKDKNTVETVQKAVELFQKNNSKYM
jgi:hypothetical protein